MPPANSTRYKHGDRYKSAVYEGPVRTPKKPQKEKSILNALEEEEVSKEVPKEEEPKEEEPKEEEPRRGRSSQPRMPRPTPSKASITARHGAPEQRFEPLESIGECKKLNPSLNGYLS